MSSLSPPLSLEKRHLVRQAVLGPAKRVRHRPATARHEECSPFPPPRKENAPVLQSNNRGGAFAYRHYHIHVPQTSGKSEYNGMPCARIGRREANGKWKRIIQLWHRARVDMFFEESWCGTSGLKPRGTVRMDGRVGNAENPRRGRGEENIFRGIKRLVYVSFR